jgi:hypothetical protein
MDIQQEWNRLNESRFAAGEPARLAVADLMQHPKTSPLIVLRRNAWINMAFAVAFLILFVALFVWYPHPYIRICLSVVMLAYLAAILFTAYKLRNLPPLPDMAGALLPVMKAYHDQLRSWLDWQEKVALFIYPVSTLGGGLLGISSEGNLDEVLQKPPVLWILAIAAILLTPAAHWLARWMGKIAFGKYLDQLKTNIDLLEKSE